MSKQKIVTADQLRKKDTKSLEALLRETSTKQAKVSLDIVMGKTKNTCAIRSGRLEIARIQTVLAEKRDLQLIENKKI